MSPPEVDVITVTPSQTTLTQELPGRVAAIRSAQIRARVEGVLERQLFQDGAVVKAGTPLFRIDSRLYQANLLAAEADYASQKALVDRYQPLLANKAVSAQEYDSAEARAKSAEAALQRARLDLEHANPVSPISGRAGRALVTEGALVGRGEPTHLTTIDQLDPIRVEFTQPHLDVLAMQKLLAAGKHSAAEATTLQLTKEDGTAYGLQGKLKFNDLSVDPATGTVALRAEFPNPKHDLLPGTFVRIHLPTLRIDKAIKIPQRSVTTSAAGQSVMVVAADGKVVPTPIVTSSLSGSDFVVSSGLKGGEQLIVNGVQKVRPGSIVKPVPWQTDAVPIPTNLTKP